MALNRDKILQEAQKLIEKKRYDKAILELQKVVAEDPSDVRTLLKIGDCHLKLEQYADAISTYERVGQHYSTQGFSVKAVAVYKQIRDIVQKHVPHLEDRFGHIVPKLAELLTSLGLTSDALAYYDEMATRLQKVGRDRDAIDIFKKIVKLDGENPLTHLRLADALIRVRDLDGAVEEYAIAAQHLLKIGRQDDALRVVERILQHRPEAKYQRLAAEIYLSRNKANDSMTALQKVALCIKESPKDLEALALLARAFDQLGRPANAIEVQKEAAKIAREAGETEVFDGLIATLQTRAPNDEGVKALVAAPLHDGGAPRAPAGGAPRTPPPGPAAPSDGGRPEPEEEEIPLSEGVEVIDDIDLEEDVSSAAAMPVAPQRTGDAPFALRSGAQGVQAPAQGLTPAQRVRQVLSEVESHRQRGDYHHAILVLQTAVSGMPAARELREKLCDVLIESGDQDQAIVEMLGFASYLAQSDDTEGAARLLDEVLLLEPTNRDALTMLEQLGYSVAEGSESAEIAYDAPSINYANSVPNVTGPFPAAGYGQPSPQYPDSAPLPSFDLDSDGPSTRTSRPPAGVVELDDPFAEAPGGYDHGGQYAPPQYASAPQPDYARQPLPSFPISEEATSYGTALDPAALHPQGARPDGQLDEAALEEIEFFQTHGMLDEAQSLLAEQLTRLPNHPLLIERKREIDMLLGGGEAAIVHDPTAPVDRSFDIASALGGLDALDAGQAPPQRVSDPGGGNQISVESVFEQFKAGVAAQVEDSDAATHYDLGVAYKEMGLFSDSIAEFELASRDPTRECVCQSMIGMMHIEHGNLDQAIDAFLRGLASGHKSAEQELALTYEIGNAYEIRQNYDQALYYFQLVARIDPSYRDPRGSVEERVSNLMGPEPVAPAPRAAVGSEDEFDSAFDDILDGKKRN